MKTLEPQRSPHQLPDERVPAPVDPTPTPRRLMRKANGAPTADDHAAAPIGPATSCFGDAINAGVHGAVERATASPGHALPESLRDRFEASLGADLSGVRVHTDGVAAVASQALGARAYATGQDIFLGAGQYAPETDHGAHLLAHEVAHTVQQHGGGGSVQTKLEVSDPGDAAEREADAVAPAMIRGESVAIRESAAAAIHRDPIPGDTIEVDAGRGLVDDVREARQESSEALDSTMGWGSAQTTEAARNARTGQVEPTARRTEIMQNAASHGTAAPLQGLSLEIDQARPLIRAWMAAGTTARTIAQSHAIDMTTPQRYAAEFHRTIGAQMNATTDGVGTQMRSELRGSSSQAVQASTAALSSCITRLQTAQRALERQKNALERAALQREVQQNQTQLTAINERIATIATVITRVAQMVAMVSGVAAGASSSLAGGQIGHDTIGNIDRFEPGGGGLVNSGPHATIQQGATSVGGGSSMIESALRFTVFASDIDAITQRVTTLNGQIAALGVRDLQLQTADVVSNLSSARTDYQSASASSANAQDNHFNAMRMAGRTYDQQGMSPEASRAIQGATARDGNTVSMEALMALVAALQSRRSARTVFGTLLGGSSHLRNAQALASRSLEGDAPAATPEGGSSQLVRPDIDEAAPGRLHPSMDVQVEAGSLRSSVQMVSRVIALYDQEHAAHTQLEEQWVAMVQRDSQGLVH